MLNRIKVWWQGVTDNTDVNGQKEDVEEKEADTSSSKRVAAGNTAVITQILTTDHLQVNVDQKEGNFNPSSDLMADFQADLQKLLWKFKSSLDDWEKKKIETLANSTSTPVAEDVRRKFAKITAEIKRCFISADEKLEDLYEKVHLIIKGLCADLNDACNVLDNEATPLAMQERLRLEICNKNIDILKEMIDLLNEIEREIAYRLTLENVSEKAIICSARFAIETLLRIPLPDINFDMEAAYRKFLIKETKNPRAKIDDMLVNAQSEMEEAVNELIKKPIENAVDEKAERKKKMEEISAVAVSRDRLMELSGKGLFKDNVRSAADKLDGEKPKLQRTMSSVF